MLIETPPHTTHFFKYLFEEMHAFQTQIFEKMEYGLSCKRK